MIGFIFYFSIYENIPRAKNLVYGNTKLYSGENLIFTSNYTDKILFSTDSGIKEFNTETGASRNINPIKPKGLAYDKKTGKFIVLDNSGRLYNIGNTGELNLVDSGYSNLYDTQNSGYYLESGSDFSYIGGFSQKNIGNYDQIKLSIK